MENNELREAIKNNIRRQLTNLTERKVEAVFDIRKTCLGNYSKIDYHYYYDKNDQLRQGSALLANKDTDASKMIVCKSQETINFIDQDNVFIIDDEWSYGTHFNVQDGEFVYRKNIKDASNISTSSELLEKGLIIVHTFNQNRNKCEKSLYSLTSQGLSIGFDDIVAEGELAGDKQNYLADHGYLMASTTLSYERNGVLDTNELICLVDTTCQIRNNTITNIDRGETYYIGANLDLNDPNNRYEEIKNTEQSRLKIECDAKDNIRTKAEERYIKQLYIPTAKQTKKRG